jgi:ketol-acid reductoisomerase
VSADQSGGAAPSGETVFYRESDADRSALAGQTVTVVGYGNLGRSMALNLRDSGLRVIVGNIHDEFRAHAIEDAFDARDIADAVRDGDVVFVLIPDEVIPDVFREQIEPALRDGAAVVFGSGYVLAFDLVKPGANVDVLLLAPRMLGEEVRRTYRESTGFLSYINVEQDVSGTAQARLLALASAAGSLQRGALQLTAQQEALLDLFVEQTVGPYLGTAFQLAFAIGTEAGLPAEALVSELYLSGEMSRTIQTMAEAGFYQSVTWHGLVATFGGFTGTLAIDKESMDRYFRERIEYIRTGGFARALQEEEAKGYPTVAAIEAITKVDNPLTDAENRVKRALGLFPDAGSTDDRE